MLINIVAACSPKGKNNPWFVAFADYCSVSTLIVACIKLPKPAGKIPINLTGFAPAGTSPL